jgi:two-component system, sensor histidine kinase and response regulator
MTRVSAQPFSVLVVDDTIENLRLLTSLLTDQGLEVRPVTSGRQALQAVASDPPDLILLDITMPDMDGLEVCTRLKAAEQSRDIPVIFLTALTDMTDKVTAFAAGGVDYITKPFQIEEVLARVRVHLALRRAQSELAESYRRLQGLEQLRDELVHMLVHDMRSPLLGLTMGLSMLEDGPTPLSPENAETLRVAIETANDLSRMANDLLDVNRLEEGQMPLERSLQDLTGIAEDVRTLLGQIDRRRRIDLASDGPVEALCDRDLIRRVLENLVGNAVKHTPPGSSVSISIERRQGGARVAVHDEGRGVPASAREKIFEKFGTVETRRNESYHSAGLGLAFCKLAIEAHGGIIGIEPRDPTGSTFWFELP